jgi:hypothetical protein
LAATSRIGAFAATAAALATVVALPATEAQAQEFVPCSTASLIGAINRANATPGPHVLFLARGCTYLLTTPDNPGNGLPGIVRDINIVGSGATIRRQSTTTFRIFDVTGPNGRLTLNNLTVRDGRSDSSGGGGIRVFNGAAATLNAVEVTRNVSGAAGVGGGIYNLGGTLTMRNSTVSYNISTNNGGGIGSTGTANISNTTITGNTARDSGGGMDSRGNLTLTGSRMTDNASGDDGGGLLAFDLAGTVTDTLIRGNSAADDTTAGGGIRTRGSTVLTVERTTVFANRALQGQGGGITHSGTSLTLRNSSVTNNFADSAPGGILDNGGTVDLIATPVVDNVPTNCSPSVITGCVD